MRRILGVVVLLGALHNAAYGDESPVCDELSTVLGTFAAAATGYQMVYVYGAPSGWVAAGLYAVGAGLASAGVKTSTEVICKNLEQLVNEVSESVRNFACSRRGTCPGPQHFAMSLARDFAVCPSCTPDEILGSAFMVDDQRERYLRRLQRQRNPSLIGFSILPRDWIGAVDASVTMSYHLGVQAGVQQSFYSHLPRL